MKHTLLQILLIAAFFSAQAQIQPTGNLTIFSEDGDPFTLVLNGEKINAIPQTNLRIEDLPQPYYNARIIFQDEKLIPVSKNNLLIADMDGVFMDVTYKVRRDKGDKMKLTAYSAIPVQQGFVPPANVVVMHYGQPQPQPAATTTHTTTTQTTTLGTPGVNMTVSPVNVNVRINDPFATTYQETVTTTTTTTTSNPVVGQPVPQQQSCVDAYPMSAKNFSSALSTVKGISFSDTQLKTAKQIAMSNCLSVNQVVQLCECFSFEETKLDFAKFAYDHCTDPNNYFKVNDVFSFSASADELNTYITGH